jgi:hypothetical protein
MSSGDCGDGSSGTSVSAVVGDAICAIQRRIRSQILGHIPLLRIAPNNYHYEYDRNHRSMQIISVTTTTPAMPQRREVVLNAHKNTVMTNADSVIVDAAEVH